MTTVEDKSNLRLTVYISLAIVAAIALAFAWPRAAMSFEVGGEIFLRLLKMVVVPLVVTSVMSGILGLGDVRKLGRPGATAIVYYVCTTVLAVTVGMVVVNTIRPGVGTLDTKTLEEIAEEVQRDLHKKAGDLLVKYFEEPDFHLLREIARHYLASKHKELGLRFGLQAATACVRGYAYQEAIEFYEMMLEFPELASNLSIEILEKIGELYSVLGKLNQALECYKRLLSLLSENQTFQRRT